MWSHGIAAIQPLLWIGLFSDDGDVARFGAPYLRIVAPVHLCFGLGLGLFFVTQGVSRAVVGMNAKAVRMITSAGGRRATIYWLDLGIAGLFPAVAAGFRLYAGMLVHAVFRVKAPSATPQTIC